MRLAQSKNVYVREGHKSLDTLLDTIHSDGGPSRVREGQRDGPSWGWGRSAPGTLWPAPRIGPSFPNLTWTYDGPCRRWRCSVCRGCEARDRIDLISLPYRSSPLYYRPQHDHDFPSKHPFCLSCGLQRLQGFLRLPLAGRPCPYTPAHSGDVCRASS
jgi:hypothetical protein